MQLGLSTKIIVAVEVVVFAVVVSSGAAALYIQKSTLEELTMRQIQSISVLKEYSVKRYINHVVEEIEHAAAGGRTGGTLSDFLQQREGEKKESVAAVLDDLSAEKDVFAGIFLMDAEGTIVVSTETSDEGKIRSGEPFFLNAGKVAIHDFYYDVASAEPELVVTAPIMNENGVLLGVLAGEIKLGDISGIMSEKSGLGETGESFLMNSSNLVVTDLLKEPGSALKKTIYLPQTMDCLKGNSISGLRKDYHGDEVYGNWHWFPEFELCTVTKIDSAEALAPMKRITFSLLGVIGIIGGLFGIVGYAFGQSIVHPLRKLRDLAVRIKEGDFTLRADADSRDEIGEIALAFNEMAGHLAAYTGDLEAAVKKRTEELSEKISEYEKLNEFMVGREVRMTEIKREMEALRHTLGDA